MNPFRDWRMKARIIWLLLTDQYTKSDRYHCWWLWKSHAMDKTNILITFDRMSFADREEMYLNWEKENGQAD